MEARPTPAKTAGLHLALMLFLFGLAYFLSLFFRSVNAILAPTLVSELGLDPASLGLLTAAYFLGLGLMQIPIGLCLDAYGPRKVQAVLLLVAAIGIGLFAAAERLALLVLARALIGLGLAGCLMAAFQVSTLWLPKERTAFANGFYLAVGGLGVLAATAPVDFALQVMHWRTLFAAIAVGTAVVAIAIAVISPDPDIAEDARWRTRVAGLGTVFRSRVFRGYLPLTALCFGTGTAMQGLWASAWFSDVAGYDGAGVAMALTGMAVALTLGSAAGGTVSLLVERRGFHLRHVVLGSATLFILSQVGLLVSPPALATIFWMLFALTYNAVTLSYALVARSVPIEFVGRSNTCMNTVVILATFALQYGLGLLLGWAGGENFRMALSGAIAGLLALQAAALAWALVSTRRVADV